MKWKDLCFNSYRTLKRSMKFWNKLQSALYKCFNDFKQQMTQEGFGVRHLCAVCFKRSFHYWTANRPYKSCGLLLFPLRPVSVAIAAGRQLSRQHLKKIKC